MIIFTRLQYKNFLSVGNTPIVHYFKPNQKQLVVGKNGSGKSCIIDALCFVLYNKAFRKCNKRQLVNTINKKSLEVEIDFTINGKEYKMRRGESPSYIELYIDGKLKDQYASSHDYQHYIESSILRMTERTFRQIVVLGSTAFIPFMRLSAGHRRIVIEDLLEITIFSNMSTLLKQHASTLQKKYENLLTSISLNNNSLQHTKQQLKMLTSSNSDLVTSNLVEIKKLTITKADAIKKIDAIVTTNNSATVLSNIQKDISKIEDEQFELMDLLSQIRLNKSKHEKENSFFDNNKHCHVCHQDISESVKNAKISSNIKKIDAFNAAVNNITLLSDKKSAAIKTLLLNVDNIRDNINKLNTLRLKVGHLTTNIAHISATNSNLAETKSTEVDKVKADINALNTLGDKYNNKKQLMLEKVASYTYISKLLQDDGIKSKIIKTYLPVINKLIRKYLDIMEFDIDFRFDEFFNETIKARYKDNFSYGNFSEGQKLRIDLCLLFTWRELSRMKNSVACNLLILDEVADATLDNEGFSALMSAIKSNKENQCTIIISHRPDNITDYVDEVHTMSLVNNFTKCTTILK